MRQAGKSNPAFADSRNAEHGADRDVVVTRRADDGGGGAKNAVVTLLGGVRRRAVAP